MAAANEQTSALARLLVVVENYPELKSNETFNRLMDELAGTENRIAVERMRYNEKVQAYNTSRRQFPANVTAGDLRLQGVQVLRGAARGQGGAEGGVSGPAEVVRPAGARRVRPTARIAAS